MLISDDYRNGGVSGTRPTCRRSDLWSTSVTDVQAVRARTERQHLIRWLSSLQMEYTGSISDGVLVANPWERRVITGSS